MNSEKITAEDITKKNMIDAAVHHLKTEFHSDRFTLQDKTAIYVLIMAAICTEEEFKKYLDTVSLMIEDLK